MESTIEPGRHKLPLAHDGLDRPYLLQVPGPVAAAPPAGLPLVLELHGRGIDPVRFDEMTGFGTLAADAGFVLVLPAAIGEIWNDGRDAASERIRSDDVGYLIAVLDDIAGRLPIDPRRIYAVGMSNGSAMTGRLACERADRFAAVAQVAGTVGARITANCHPTRPVPILNIAGDADCVAPYEGGVRRGLLNRAMIRRAAGPSLGVDEWARFWVGANGAGDGPVTSTLPPDTTVRTWHGATPSSDVVFYRVEGAGHTWPGSRFTLPPFLFGRTSRTFDGATVIWQFFKAHPG